MNQKKILVTAPIHPKAFLDDDWLEHILSLKKAGKHAEIIDEINHFQSLHGKRLKVEQILATSLIDLGKNNEAISVLETATHMEKTDSKALHHLAHAHQQIGNFHDSIKVCQQILNTENTTLFTRLSSYRILIKSFLAIDEPQNAKKTAQELLTLETDDIKNLQMLGNIFQILDMHAESLKYWLKILEIDQHHDTAYRQSIAQYIHLNKTQDALHQSKLYIRNTENILPSFRAYFDCCRRKQIWPAVERLISHFRKRLKNGTYPPNKYIEILLAKNEMHEALDVLSKYKSSLTKEQQTEHSLYIYTKLHDYAQAETVLQQNPTYTPKSISLTSLNKAIAFQNKWCTKSTTYKHDFRKHVLEHFIQRCNSDTSLKIQPKPGSVVFIHNSFQMGGGTKQALLLARNLPKRFKKGTTINFCVFSHRKKEREDFLKVMLDNTNVETIRIPEYLKEYDHPLLDQDPFFKDLDLKTCEFARIRHLMPLIKTIQRLRPEVIYTRGMHIYECAIVGLLLGVPKVVGHFGNVPESWLVYPQNVDFMEMLSFAINKTHNKGFLTLTANSEAAINEWSSHLQISKDKFKLISNIIEAKPGDTLDEPKQIIYDLKERYNIPQDAFIVGGAFRYHWSKNPKLWVRIAGDFSKKCPNAYFLLIGDGVLEQEIKRLARQLNFYDRLILPGPQRDNINHFYAAMDIFLLASFTESLPNVIIEAQLNGLPVLATDVGGSREAMIPEVTGWVFKPTDIQGFTNQMMWLHDNPDHRKKITENAQKMVLERYSSDKIIGSLIDSIQTPITL